MRDHCDTPHRLAGDRMAQLLPDFRPTPLDEVLRLVLARRRGLAVAA